MADSKQSWRKWLLGALGVLLLLVTTVYAVEQYGESYVQERLPQLSDNLGYKLNLADVHLSLWRHRLELEEITAARKPTATTDSTSLARFNVDAITVEGISSWSWLWGDTLNIDQISLTQPVATLQGRTDDFKTDSTSFWDKSGSGNLLPTKIRQFQVNGGHAKLLHPADSTEEASVNDVSLQFHDLVINPSASADSLKLIVQYGALELAFTDFYSQSPRNFYDISLKQGWISSMDSSLVLDSLVVTPRYPKYKFAQEFGYEIDRVELLISQVSLRQLNFKGLVQGRLHAHHLQLKNPRMEIFHDKHMPFPPKPHRPLPHQRLADLPLTLHLDTIVVDQGRITYSEHFPQVDKPGTVVFGDLNASIYNLSNDFSRQSSDSLILEARTSVMDAAPLQVKATLPLDAADHHVEGTLGTMPMQELNAVTEPLGFVSLTAGQIHDLEFDMELNSREVTGTVWLKYSDLNIEVLNSKNGNGRDKEMLSFIANTFKIKSANKKPLREGTIAYERDPQRSIFSYWWKGLLSGLKSSIGL